VGVETADLFHDLAELRMWHARRRLHNNRLVHPVGNHFADARFARSAGVFRRQWRWLCYWLGCLLGHKLFLLFRLGLFSRSRLRLRGAIRKNRFNPRHITTDQTQPAWLFELSALLLQTEMQSLLAKIASLCQQLVRTHLNDFLNFHVR
jgi:hypothetical protein